MPESSRVEIARLQEEYEKNPEGRLFVHLAEAYRRSGELEKARAILNQGLERHSDYLSARIVLAPDAGVYRIERGARTDITAGKFATVITTDDKPVVVLLHS